jgi:cyclopropane fatty-acyl-phospholipid synthase-like methyltransferase
VDIDLDHPRFPRSSGYDASWVAANQMGPHALWLIEALTEVLTIEPGTRVLDLGCGRAMTSIFLANEFGAHVTAADLWIPADENQQRIEAANAGDRVQAVHAEAHALPFGTSSFDVIVSVDAYHYFGTDDLYIGYISEFLRPGGHIGIVVPGTTREVGEAVPPHLVEYWDWEFCSFHSPEWWRRHWSKTGRVDVDHADLLTDGWLDWLRFSRATLPTLDGWRLDAARQEIALLEADRGATLGFTRVTATRPRP